MKFIIITGVSTGLGYGTAKICIKQGYTVIGGLRKQADADRLQTEFGEKFIPLIWDVTKEADSQAAADKVKDLCGTQEITALINNAGISHTGPLMHMPISEVRQQFEVNVMGLVSVTQAILPSLIASHKQYPTSGRIINISSVGGKVAMPLIAAYVGTKHAMEGISHSLRRELQVYGLDVIIVGPGAVQTEIMGKQFENDAMAKYANTDYVPAVQSFQKMADSMMDKGMTLEEFSKRMLHIIETPKPKKRYAIVKGRFANYDLMRLIPTGMLDRMVGKMLKLL